VTYAPATNIDRMMELLGIDVGYSVVPQFGLAFSQALRTCCSCSAHGECTEWLATGPDAPVGPPKFCPCVDLLWDLLCDPAVSRVELWRRRPPCRPPSPPKLRCPDDATFTEA
jgi:Family of unknown function (DUF6455)